VPSKEPKREFKVGDKVRVNLRHGKIEDAVVRAVIHHDDRIKLQLNGLVDFLMSSPLTGDKCEFREGVTDTAVLLLPPAAAILGVQNGTIPS
jgi:hypothetical protein